jgi:hypothetical protein
MIGVIFVIGNKKGKVRNKICFEGVRTVWEKMWVNIPKGQLRIISRVHRIGYTP